MIFLGVMWVLILPEKSAGKSYEKLKLQFENNSKRGSKVIKQQREGSSKQFFFNKNKERLKISSLSKFSEIIFSNVKGQANLSETFDQFQLIMSENSDDQEILETTFTSDSACLSYQDRQLMALGVIFNRKNITADQSLISSISSNLKPTRTCAKADKLLLDLKGVPNLKLEKFKLVTEGES